MTFNHAGWQSGQPACATCYTSACAAAFRGRQSDLTFFYP